MDKTNKERLATIEEAIKHIDGNIDKIAKNNVNQWKTINENTVSIAELKTTNVNENTFNNRKLVIYSALIGALVGGGISVLCVTIA